MLHGNPAIIKSGMPLNHGDAFKEVARAQNAIIISRSVGKYATGLIQENYATKGFHVKAKSCNFGPMAGFVLADPRFSKKGMAGQESQKKAIQKAMHEGATRVGLYISNTRRAELLQLFANPPTQYREIAVRGTQAGRDEFEIQVNKNGLILLFVLVRTPANEVPGGSAEDLWAVCYRGSAFLPDSIGFSSDFKINSSFGQLYQVLALTDPLGDQATKATYRGAMTGDYDLWGCFPREANFKPNGIDERMVQHSGTRVFDYHQFGNEHQHLGNMTQRLMVIRLELNAGFIARGYSGGNLVHHSDEAGRPMVDNVEVDSVAFFPNGDVMYFENLMDYRAFLATARQRNFHPILNATWRILDKVMNRDEYDPIYNRQAHVDTMNQIRP